MTDTVKHIEFITECKRAGIHGGRKRTFFETCVRLREKGNQRAEEILAKFYPGE